MLAAMLTAVATPTSWPVAEMPEMGFAVSRLGLLPDAPQAAGAPPPDGAPADDPSLPGRRRPGTQKPLPPPVSQNNAGAVSAPPPEAFPTDEFPVPDRWRLLNSLCPTGSNAIYQLFGALENACHTRRDPYHQNTLKGDRPLRNIPKWLPIKGDDWFLDLDGISDTVIEPRSFPEPVGGVTSARPGSNDNFGRDYSTVYSQTFILSAGLIKGMTTFKPPEIEYRVALGINANYVTVSERNVLSVLPTGATHRFDHFVGVQELFVDKHLRNTSDRYDFMSLRVGIQPFQSDFRGFLFNDNQLGMRLFGNRDNNRFQFNLAAFRRLEKDTNSGLNDITATPRKDYIFIANLFRQDFPVVGVTSQMSVNYNMNREATDIHYDKNGFPVRPALIGDGRARDYDVVYLGYSLDGHFGRINLTSVNYLALGRDRNNIFTGQPANIRAFFAAAEPSIDFNWIRWRLSALYASGNHNPYSNTESGFDAISENPIFAGADTSYWIRQSIPLVGGGGVGLSGRNGVLADLRTSKDEGQSNFNNPGTILVGTGADLDLTPKFRISANLNHLWFVDTAVLQTLRNQGNIPRDIGWDLSSALVWRPKAIQNVVLRLSVAALIPGAGLNALVASTPRDRAYYSILFNPILSF